MIPKKGGGASWGGWGFIGGCPPKMGVGGCPNWCELGCRGWGGNPFIILHHWELKGGDVFSHPPFFWGVSKFQGGPPELGGGSPLPLPSIMAPN